MKYNLHWLIENETERIMMVKQIETQVTIVSGDKICLSDHIVLVEKRIYNVHRNDVTLVLEALTVANVMETATRLVTEAGWT